MIAVRDLSAISLCMISEYDLRSWCGHDHWARSLGNISVHNLWTWSQSMIWLWSLGRISRQYLCEHDLWAWFLGIISGLISEQDLWAGRSSGQDFREWYRRDHWAGSLNMISVPYFWIWSLGRIFGQDLCAMIPGSQFWAKSLCIISEHALWPSMIFAGRISELVLQTWSLNLSILPFSQRYFECTIWFYIIHILLWWAVCKYIPIYILYISIYPSYCPVKHPNPRTETWKPPV